MVSNFMKIFYLLIQLLLQSQASSSLSLSRFLAASLLLVSMGQQLFAETQGRRETGCCKRGG
uniref:Putative ovule protein n=1 Tax=Solanum chacoense TaxID=4108 RepID=A0A0V0HBT9_SOLCH